MKMSYYQSCSCETGNWKAEFVLFEGRIECEDLDKSILKTFHVS